MGVRILHDSEQGMAALYCSTSDVAFGPIFGKGDAPEYKDADERIEAFLRWLRRDPREYDDSALMQVYTDWLAQEAAQYQREDAAERQQWADELAED